MRKIVGGRPGQGTGPLSTRNNGQEAPRLYAHLTPETPFSPASDTNTRRRTRPRPLRTTLICAAGLLVLSAGILAAGPIASHLPNLVLGACIVALGIMFGAMLAVRA